MHNRRALGSAQARFCVASARMCNKITEWAPRPCCPSVSALSLAGAIDSRRLHRVALNRRVDGAMFCQRRGLAELCADLVQRARQFAVMSNQSEVESQWRA